MSSLDTILVGGSSLNPLEVFVKFRKIGPGRRPRLFRILSRTKVLPFLSKKGRKGIPILYPKSRIYPEWKLFNKIWTQIS